MVKQLRTNLKDEKNCDYFLHAPTGIIEVAMWNYMVPGFVIVGGVLENKLPQFFVYAEEVILGFPLEVRMKNIKSGKGHVGFSPSFKAKSVVINSGHK